MWGLVRRGQNTQNGGDEYETELMEWLKHLLFKNMSPDWAAVQHRVVVVSH